jgi:hypothetical protein
MAIHTTRRLFLKKSVAAVAAMQTPIQGVEEGPAEHFLCITCGIQFAPSKKPPASCPVCEDERQYVGWKGQQWTTLAKMQGHYRNTLTEEETNLHAIHTDPKIGIGQRAFVIRTAKGNLLWDCVPHLDEATVKAVKDLGGLAAIAVSHPHYYTTMVERSHAFGKVPIYLHDADAKWAMRPDPAIQFWKGETNELFGGLTLINTGGHFDGFQVVHWQGGGRGKGALLSGDQPQVCQDRRWVSFMYSYPNLIPLPAAAIRRITMALKPYSFARLYGAFPGLTVTAEAKDAVERSAARYLKAIGV